MGGAGGEGGRDNRVKAQLCLAQNIPGEGMKTSVVPWFTGLQGTEHSDVSMDDIPYSSIGNVIFLSVHCFCTSRTSHWMCID